ncbi:uncharacterized protein PG998_010606 [Apiospora kogelbergensis]|uniref:uncharacterized protein n=1 Tax=Apiospora kogelbergensis TaxID=1337665 RepID=UPI003130AFA6
MERQEGNTYGYEKEPDYSILTYTWGRWQAPGGAHIAVSGTTWAIPAVNESMFTVKSFQNVIKKMGETHDFAWIDVVCIDQENHAVRMDEIGRQAGIFNLAARVYVWLWTLPAILLQSTYDEVEYCIKYIVPEYRDELDPDITRTLKSVHGSVRTILDDFWFSSLWTLQEGILRPDAILLSQEAEQVRVRYSTQSIELQFLANTFWNLRVILETHDVRPKEASLTDLIQSIVRSLKRAGYSTDTLASNPNIQWGAARWRTVSSEQDRVYGIQAIYNIRVGESVPNAVIRQHHPLLAELQMEFAASINAKSPLLGQMFIHSEPPHKGRTWQLCSHIKVPPEFCTYNEKYSSTCSITGTPAGYAQIEGKICFLNDLARLWNERATHQPLPGGLYLKVSVDEYIPQNHPGIYSVPEDLTEIENYVKQVVGVSSSAVLVDSILRVFGFESVSVLELGTYTSSLESHAIGLLLLHTPEDRTQTKRIGICRWSLHASIQERHPLFEVEWVQYQGSLS